MRSASGPSATPPVSSSPVPRNRRRSRPGPPPPTPAPRRPPRRYTRSPTRDCWPAPRETSPRTRWCPPGYQVLPPRAAR
ncbi:hypothetical protein FPZ47_02375 [Mycobacterium helveticum]|uniref:Uncharacterized protein n=1 Tax=Mycobacterium helveticum TaxID=2592811 RepID=A0A557Y0M2_9MYCO|nr:hypothetical protein FPZ46_04070 [Mycobacterium helveticum]TVS92092.1 hypothetical protein FPZ47_02375 [Mycobacterium helveticum]